MKHISRLWHILTSTEKSALRNNLSQIFPRVFFGGLCVTSKSCYSEWTEVEIGFVQILPGSHLSAASDASTKGGRDAGKWLHLA